jgi:hypothetical protein
MCRLGQRAAAPFYLYLISKTTGDFSGCRNAPPVAEDGYSIVGNRAYGPDVDVRCYIDPNVVIGDAVGVVYSSSEPANREAAYTFCRNAGGYDFN